jgi:hypothetical protein
VEKAIEQGLERPIACVPSAELEAFRVNDAPGAHRVLRDFFRTSWT